MDKCKEARQKIFNQNKNLKNEQLICEKLDVSSLKDVKRFGEQFKGSKKPLDSLILNAGVMCK